MLKAACNNFDGNMTEVVIDSRCCRGVLFQGARCVRFTVEDRVSNTLNQKKYEEVRKSKKKCRKGQRYLEMMPRA